MILDILPQLRHLRLVLASASPRRRDLLRDILGLEPEVRPSTFAEDLPHADFPSAAEYALATATEKCVRVYEEVAAEGGVQVALLIGADSIVVSADGKILEKAGDAASAAAMLRTLSGSVSHVTTALILVTPPDAGEHAPHVWRHAETTTVHFATLSEAEIAAYVAQPKAWEGKAGAYGIQDLAAAFIERIDGDYYTVMGLPVHRLACAIRQLVDEGRIALPEE